MQLGNQAGGQEAQGMKIDEESLIFSEGTVEDCAFKLVHWHKIFCSPKYIYILNGNIAAFNSELWVRHILTPLKNVPTV